MLDFTKQEQIEQNYFKDNARGKKLYEAFDDFLWNLPGYKDPKKEFTHIGMSDAERNQVFKDYSNIQKNEAFGMEKSCKEMLESKIAYHWHKDETGTELVSKTPSYLYKYIMIYGFNKVAKWAQELIDKVDHISQSIYTDSEGISYNSIVYKK